jgi:phosphinothricin acetyltransferase
MIRSGRPGDSDRIATIFNEFIASGGLTDTDQMVTSADRRSWLEQHGGPYPVYVWDDGGDIAGWSSISPLSSRPHDPKLAEIGVYVARQYRGRGIGGRLVMHALDNIDVRRIHLIVAIIFARNGDSLRLFGKVGFEQVAYLREPACLRDRWEDVLWLARAAGSEVSHLVPETEVDVR